MSKKMLQIAICIIVLQSCNRANETSEITKDFLDVFNRREDFDEFLDFYDDDVVLDDIINGDKIKGKDSLRAFFNWGHPDFKKIGDSTLVVKRIVSNGNEAVVKGYFTAFKWGDKTFEPMHFTIILTFNESGKIIHHIDWINYPSTLVDYQNRKNSNEWIRE